MNRPGTANVLPSVARPRISRNAPSPGSLPKGHLQGVVSPLAGRARQSTAKDKVRLDDPSEMEGRRRSAPVGGRHWMPHGTLWPVGKKDKRSNLDKRRSISRAS